MSRFRRSATAVLASGAAICEAGADCCPAVRRTIHATAGTGSVCLGCPGKGQRAAHTGKAMISAQQLTGSGVTPDQADAAPATSKRHPMTAIGQVQDLTLPRQQAPRPGQPTHKGRESLAVCR